MSVRHLPLQMVCPEASDVAQTCRSMGSLGTLDRAVGAVRIAVAALALAVALLLALKIPLVATFRAALLVLAAVEVLAFGRRVLSSDARPLLWVEIAVKLAVLAAAYLVLAS